jgi:ribosomal protein S4
MFKLKEKNKLCRKYTQDIFGNLIKKKKINKVIIYLLKLKKEKWERFKPFYLDINVPKPLKRRKSRTRFCKNLDILKKLSFFYGGLRKKKIKQIGFIAKKKKGIFLDNFLLLLELRLCVIIFKMNFCKTILEAIHFIYAGYILVNKTVIKNINYIVKIGDVIEVINYKRKYFYINFIKNCFKKQLLELQTHYLIINYELMSCIVITNPKPELIKYPFKIKKQYTYMLQNSLI